MMSRHGGHKSNRNKTIIQPKQGGDMRRRGNEDEREKRRVLYFKEIARLSKEGKDSSKILDIMMKDVYVDLAFDRIPDDEIRARIADFRSKFWGLITRYNKNKEDKEIIIVDFRRKWNYMFRPRFGD